MLFISYNNLYSLHQLCEMLPLRSSLFLYTVSKSRDLSYNERSSRDERSGHGHHGNQSNRDNSRDSNNRVSLGGRKSE